MLSLWSDNFWLPENSSWHELKNTALVSYPQANELKYSVYFGVVLLLVRLLWESLIMVPLGHLLGFSKSKKTLSEQIKTHVQYTVFTSEKSTRKRVMECTWHLRSNMHIPSLLQRFIANSLPSAGVLSYYLDGSCFYAPISPQLSATSTANIRPICPKVNGLASRVAHLDTTAKTNLAQSFGRVICESAGNTGSQFDGCYKWQMGLEQLKGCVGNTCSEEGGYSWFWTTPEGYKFPANIQQGGFWAPGYPTDISSELNFAVFFGATYGYQDSSRYTYSAICEYVAPYPSYSNFENACLLSNNPSAFGYSTCFTLNRNATTFASAQSQCTEFRNGQLAQVNTSAMATFLSSSLWAMMGLPPSMPLFTGLQQISNQWYWINPDGTQSLANSGNLPWNTTQPQSGQCASVTQNGYLITTSCTASQWFLCQYPNPVIENFKGWADAKGSPAAAISETNSDSINNCQQSCQNNGNCTSFAYSYSTSTCQLIGGGGGSSSTIRASGFMWFSLV